MIVDFTFGNFRSFKDQATLSLIAASKLHGDPSLDKGNVFNVPDPTKSSELDEPTIPPQVQHPAKLSLLLSTAIYGANASGKSNVINAFKAFCNTVVNSANTNFVSAETSFLFSTLTIPKPIFFEMTLFLDNMLYRYGFEMMNAGSTAENFIASEWLYRAKSASAKEALLFERTDTEVKRGREFTEGTVWLSKMQSDADGHKITRRKDSLFLSLSAQIEGKISKRIVDYLSHNIKIIVSTENSGFDQFTKECLESGRYRDIIARLLKAADTGIVNVHLAEEYDTIIQIQAMSNLPIPSMLTSEGRALMQKTVLDKLQVLSEHHIFDPEGKQKASVRIPFFFFESQGTQRLWEFAGPVADILAKGAVLIVDEIDIKLHPLLTRALIRLFQSPDSNPHHAQLIFATHDTNLLDKRIFRRDQIWFVEKDRLGASHLYSLAEFKAVRKEASFEGNYIAGRYGAIPFLGDLTRVFTDEHDSDTDDQEEVGHPTDEIATNVQS